MNKILFVAFFAGIGSLLLIPFTLSQVDGQEKSVPEWVKNTAGFWFNGAISDTEFLNAIEFLLQEGIIQVSSNIGEPIPSAIAQLSVYTKSKGTTAWGLGSSASGQPNEIYCDKGDVALSAGFEADVIGVFASSIVPIKEGFAIGLVNLTPERTGATVWITCMKT